MKSQSEKIAVLTSYDASFTTRIEEAGADVILVGDSLGGVIQGKTDTLSVTMDDVAYHLKHVATARTNSLLIADMPYHTYITIPQAIENAKRLIDAGADMVKLEGVHDNTDIKSSDNADKISASIEKIIQKGIPVCGHLGLLPQSVNELGGYKVQGKEVAAREQMLSDAKLLESLGVDMIVLECIPSDLAKTLSSAISIPTIGIGAGIDCDGQVLVLYDLLGITPGKLPRFVKNYLSDDLSSKNDNKIVNAISNFVSDVKQGKFPGPEHSY